SPLYMANCRFLINRREEPQHGQDAIRIHRSSACECRNCLFVAGGGSGLDWWPSERATLAMDNCLAVGNYGVIVADWDRPGGRPSSVRLTRNTLRVASSLALGFSNDTGRLTEDVPDREFRVDSVGNVMGSVGLHLNQISGEKQLPAAEIEALLQRLVVWK